MPEGLVRECAGDRVAWGALSAAAAASRGGFKELAPDGRAFGRYVLPGCFKAEFV